MITPTQREVFSFIHDRIKLTGYAPSYQEIADAVKSKSTASVHRLIVELEQRGYLIRSPGRARGIRLLQVPVGSENLHSDDLDACGTHAMLKGNPRAWLVPDAEKKASYKPCDQKSAPQKVETSLSSLNSTPRGHLNAEILLTVLGRCDHFSMVVDDNVMEQNGILNGDTVILHRCDKVSSGDIVAVAIEGRLTLRRMIRRGKRVSLETNDARYEMIVVPFERLKIHGRMVVLLREC